MVGVLVAASLSATACTNGSAMDEVTTSRPPPTSPDTRDDDPRRQDESVETDPDGWVYGILDGDGRTLSEICGVGACVAGVVLPQRHFVDPIVDLDMPETLAALSVERVPSSTESGMFGDGWVTALDVRVTDGVIFGPLPARPLSQPETSATIDLSDGTRVSFDADGRLSRLCPPGALCADIEWRDETVRVAAPLLGAADEDDADGDTHAWIEVDLKDGRPNRIRSWDGRSVSYGYAQGRLTRAGSISYQLDGVRPVEIGGRHGGRSIEYDDDGLVSAISDGDGRGWTFAGSSEGVRVESDEGRLEYEFDDAERLIEIVDVDGGAVLRREYLGRSLWSESRPLDGVTAEMISVGHLRITESDPLGPDRVVDHFHDADGRLIRTDAAGATSTYVYGDSGELVRRRDAGSLTSFEYDESGLLRTTRDADGYEISLERDRVGNIVAVRDHTTSTDIDVDGLGRPVEQRDGSTTTHRAAFDGDGRLASTETAGITTEYDYDDTGALLSASVDGRSQLMAGPPTATPPPTSEGSLLVVSRASTGDGTMYSYSDGSSIEFDAVGRPITIATTSGTERRAYDSDGRLSRLESSRGRIYELGRSAAGRITSLVVDGERFDVAWDGSRLVEVTSGSGLDLSYGWNDSGLVESITANGMRWDYAFDGAGNVDGIDTPMGVVRTTWDDDARPVEVASNGGAVSEIEWVDDDIVSIANDDDVLTFTRQMSDGRLVQIQSGGETIESFEYDGSGRLIGGTRRVDAADESFAIEYTGDRITHLTVGDHTESWSYSDGAIRTVTDQKGERYEIDWQTPGVVRSIAPVGDDPLVETSVDEMGNVNRVMSTGDRRDEFSWNSGELVGAEIDGSEIVIERSGLGQVTRFVDATTDYTARFDGVAPTEIVANGLSVGFDYADGRLARSASDVDGQITRIDWLSNGLPNAIAVGDDRASIDYSADGVSRFFENGVAESIDYNPFGVSDELDQESGLGSLFNRRARRISCRPSPTRSRASRSWMIFRLRSDSNFRVRSLRTSSSTSR